MKDPNFLDYVAKEIRTDLEAQGVEEYKIDEIIDNLGEHFRYGEYLDLVYDLEKDKLEISK
jgi:hypothetical protein